MSTAEVTIIIPHYEVWRLLERAINSALQQTVKCDVIVIDDMSPSSRVDEMPDGVWFIRNTRTKIGWPHVINMCVELAKTPYVVILNGDDQLHPDMVEACLRVAKDYGNEVVFPTPKNSLSKDLLFANNLPYCALIRKATFKTMGGYKEIVFADWDFWIRCWKAGISSAPVGRDGLFMWTDRPDGETRRMQQTDEYINAVKQLQAHHA